jgi:hypothetical protein
MEEIDPAEVPPVAPASIPRTIDKLQALFRSHVRTVGRPRDMPPAWWKEGAAVDI